MLVVCTSLCMYDYIAVSTRIPTSGAELPLHSVFASAHSSVSLAVPIGMEDHMPLSTHGAQARRQPDLI